MHSAARGTVAALVALVALVAACAPVLLPSPSAPPLPSPPIHFPSPSAPASLAPGASPTPIAPSGPLQEGVVMRIVDGDSVWVRFGGRDWRVRYIGMDAPELREAVPEPWALDATEANRGLVEGREVMLETDVSETDRFGRLLRYVWLPAGTATDGATPPTSTDGTDTTEWILVNLEMVRLGYARAVSFPPDVRYQDHLLAAEEDARENGAGLWGEP